MSKLSDNNSTAKRHQTTLRLTDEMYDQIKQLAGENGKMSDVLSHGIEVQWEYYQKVTKLLQQIPKFDNKESLAKWTAEQFKNDPELMLKYSTATAINAHTKALNTQQETYQLLINEFDTFNYLIRTIGNNINQLARQANEGIAVPRNELGGFTKSIIKLNTIANEIKKQVTNNGLC